MGKYANDAKELLRLVGGKENIASRLNRCKEKVINKFNQYK